MQKMYANLLNIPKGDQFIDRPDEWYNNLFANLQTFNKEEFVDFIQDFILKTYTIQNHGIEPKHWEVNDEKISQWVLHADDPNLFLKDNYEYDYLKKENWDRLHDECFNVYKLWQDNDEFMKNHRVLDVIMLITQTANIAGIQYALKRSRQEHLNTPKSQFYDKDCKYDVKYTLDKDKILKMCTKSDDDLKRQSADCVEFDFEFREFFLYRGCQKVWFLTKIEDKDGYIRFSIHCNSRYITYNTKTRFNDDYKIFELFVNPDGSMEIADNPIFDKIYNIIPFDIDKAYTTTIETRFNFHTVDRFDKIRKHVVQHDNKSVTYLSLASQGYKLDSYLSYKNNFSSEMIELLLMPIVNNLDELKEFNGLDKSYTADYFELACHMQQNFFYHMKKFLFNIIFAYKIGNKDINKYFYETNSWSYEKQMSFFDTRRFARHVTLMLDARGIKLSSIKNSKDLKDILFEDYLIRKMDISLTKDEGDNKLYTLNIANGISVSTILDTIYKYNVTPLFIEILLLKTWLGREGIESVEAESSEEAYAKLVEKKIIDKVGEDYKITDAYIEKSLKDLGINPKMGTNSISTYATVVMYMEKWLAAFDANSKDIEVKDEPNKMFIFKENIFDKDNDNNGRNIISSMFVDETITDESFLKMNFIQSLGFDTIYNNLKNYGYLLPMSEENRTHVIADGECEGILKSKVVTVEEYIKNGKDLGEYFDYKEERVVNNFNNLLLRGTINIDLDMTDDDSVKFRSSKRWVSPIYDSNFNVTALIFSEIIYDIAKERQELGTINLYVDALNMAAKMGLPLKSTCSTPLAVKEYHDELSNIMNIKELEKIKKNNSFRFFNIGIDYIDAVVKLKSLGYEILDDSLSLAYEGQRQSNCINSYSNREDRGELLLVSYLDSVEKRVSIEIHGNGRNGYSVNQMKLKANRNPSEALRAKIEADVASCTENIVNNDAILKLKKARVQVILKRRLDGEKIDLNGFIYSNGDDSKKVKYLDVDNITVKDIKELEKETPEVRAYIESGDDNSFEIKNLKMIKAKIIEKISNKKVTDIENLDVSDLESYFNKTKEELEKSIAVAGQGQAEFENDDDEYDDDDDWD